MNDELAVERIRDLLEQLLTETCSVALVEETDNGEIYMVDMEQLQKVKVIIEDLELEINALDETRH